jgi:hypothetical protein
MPFCSKCGVEVDDIVEVCPLCGTPVQKFNTGNEIPRTPYPPENPSPNKKPASEYNLTLVWIIITVIFFIPLFALLTINFEYKGSSAWTGYALSSIISAWLCVTIVFTFRKNYIICSAGIMAVLSLLLFFFDFLYDNMTWFFPFGLPALFLLYILAIAVIILSSKVKEKGLNIIAFILIAAGLFCFGFDSLFTLMVIKIIKPSWSLIILSVLFPTALLFLFLHHKMKKRIKFKRFFHI